jgi:hypothetical protein
MSLTMKTEMKTCETCETKMDHWWDDEEGLPFCSSCFKEEGGQCDGCHWDDCVLCNEEEENSLNCEVCGHEDTVVHDWGCVALCETCSMADGEPHCPRTSRSGEAEQCEWCVSAWAKIDGKEEDEECPGCLRSKADEEYREARCCRCDTEMCGQCYSVSPIEGDDECYCKRCAQDRLDEEEEECPGYTKEEEEAQSIRFFGSAERKKEVFAMPWEEQVAVIAAIAKGETQ